MAVKRVLQYGEKSLREPSKEVHKVSKKIQELVQDLLETMYAKNGVGLAAPQIGVNLRVFVIDVSKNERLDKWHQPKVSSGHAPLVQRVVLRAANQNFNDCRWQSYHNL